MAIFDDAEVSLPCPSCGHEHKKTMRWLQDETQFTCEGCGKPITLDNAKLRDDMGKVDNAWDNLLGSFKQ